MSFVEMKGYVSCKHTNINMTTLKNSSSEKRTNKTKNNNKFKNEKPEHLKAFPLINSNY